MAKKELTKVNKKTGKLKTAKTPSKRTMNFVHHEASFNVSHMIPLILVMIILAGAFVKLGIMDPTAKKALAYEELSNKQMQLASANAAISDYDNVAYQYGRYSYGWMNEQEINLISRMDVLKLVEEKIVPQAVVENVSINNNVLTMNIHGLTLHQASDLVNDLENSPIVTSATVYNAVASEAVDAVIFLSINLVKPEKEVA